MRLGDCSGNSVQITHDLLDLLVFEHELAIKANDSPDPRIAESVSNIMAGLHGQIASQLEELGLRNPQAIKSKLALQLRQISRAKDAIWQVLGAEAARLVQADASYDGN